jgi:hypothetical protein
MGAGGPRDLAGDGAYAAEVFSGVGGVGLGRGLSEGGGGCEEDEEDAHEGIVSERNLIRWDDLDGVSSGGEAVEDQVVVRDDLGSG